MLIIRVNCDIITSYLYYYAKELIKEAENKGIKVTKLEGDRINEVNLRGMIKKVKPKFIFFNGHGDENSLFSDKEKKLVDINSKELLKNTITYAIACSSLKGLGLASVNGGCKAFIGYNKNFWLARNHSYESNPLKDDVARPVIECSNIVVKSLLKGNTVKETIKRSHEKSTDYILKLIYSNDPLASATLSALTQNDSSLDYYGEDSAKII